MACLAHDGDLRHAVQERLGGEAGAQAVAGVALGIEAGGLVVGAGYGVLGGGLGSAGRQGIK
jgi:hypothetical protein